jgi:hypothetical protein
MANFLFDAIEIANVFVDFMRKPLGFLIKIVNKVCVDSREFLVKGNP